jgi:hypothetical protein
MFVGADARHVATHEYVHVVRIMREARRSGSRIGVLLERWSGDEGHRGERIEAG